MNYPTDTKSYVLVAHRAGNRPDTVASALQRADLVELDAHVFRGRVEVRHAKVVRPTSRLWEKWYFLPANTPVPTLADALDAVPPELQILLDLKCFTRQAARRILREIPAGRRLLVSCRSWWVLPVFGHRPHTILLRSCGSQFQIWLATLMPGLAELVGVVAHQRLLTSSVVAALRRRTPHVFTWDVRTVERGRDLTSWGVTGLIVDDLSLNWTSLRTENGTDPPLA